MGSVFGRHSRSLIAFLMVSAAGPCSFAGKEYLAKAGEPVAPNQLVVGLETGASIQQIVAAVAPHAVVSLVSSVRNTYLLSLSPGIQAAVSTLLAAQPLVQFVEPNRILHATVLPPNDRMLNEEWALTTVQAAAAWSYFPDRYLTAANPGANRVKVAILDTGVDCTHPDFMNAGGSSTDSAQGGQLDWSDSRALVATTISSPACPWQDDNGHGTHTAGTIVAATNNGAGVASLGFPLQLVVYKVLDGTGNGSESNVSSAIDDAVAAGAQAISMSFDGDGYSQAVQSAIDYAWEHNVLAITAAGNTSNTNLEYPGAANHALTVAATDSTNTRASFSTYGNWVKIAAPGVNVLSTLPTYSNTFGLNYGSLNGTSMATPHVAALAGLLFMANPGLSVAAVAQRIQQTAQTPYTGWDQYIGYGVINAAAALGGILRPATQGSLGGQVLDSINQPINGALVTAGGQSFITAIDPTTGSSDGLFRIANLSPGTYPITVSASGYSTVNLQAAVVAGADTMLTIPMGVSLGEFTGTVKLNGAPVAGAAVEAISGGLNMGAAVTDASGSYALYVPAGTYTLTASAFNDIGTTSGSHTLSGGGTVTVNLLLSSLGNLTGTVVDANGLAVAGAHIDFTSTGFSGGAVTNAAGSYTTFGIPAGTYTVTASASGYGNAVASGVSVTANTPTLVNLHFSTGISLGSGMLGYWPFDEGAGSVAHDQSGNGYDATLSATAWTAGKFDFGLSFNGAGSYGLTPAIPLTSAFSISAWANPAVTTQTSFAAIAETDQRTGLYLGVDTTGTQYKFIVNDAAGSSGTCGSSLGCAQGGAVTSGWHLVSGTYDGAAAILYVDGAMVVSDTANTPMSASLPLEIGRCSVTSAAWNGALDDLRLYNRALTALEVSSLYTLVLTPNLGLTKTADAATVAAGASIGYTLTVTNSGAGTATAATLNDVLLSGTGMEWSISPPYSGPGTCSVAGTTLSCGFGNLAAGGSASVHVTSATSASSCAAYPNTATASASNNGAVQASATTTVQCPVLGLTKTADAATVAAGAAIGYTLTVTNSGAGTATAATLSDVLPSGTGIAWGISPPYSGPGTCSIAGQALSCSFGNLAAGGMASVHVTSATSAASCAAYPNIATVSASNNGAVQASATTTVQCPSLNVQKTHQGAFTQGQPGVAYTVTVSNGSSVAPTSGSVSVAETVPAGLFLVSMAGSGWICPAGGITCARSDPLNAGATYPAITVAMNVAATAAPQVINRVTVSGGGSHSASASDPTAILPFTCAVTGDQAPSVADVQAMIGQALGDAAPVDDLNHDGVVTVADVQKVIDAVLGLGCLY
jgi:uncharacterized repeat protein (TIGR01451 family)